MNEERSDRELLNAYAAGGAPAAEAFRCLVARHGAMVDGACRRVLCNRALAEEAAQATFIVLVRKARRIRGEVGAYLYRTAVTVSRYMRRKEAALRKRERKAAEMVSKGRGSSGDGADWAAIRPHLDEAVAGLPEAQRAAVVLHYMEGLSYGEVARRMSVSEGTVASRLHRALGRMRRFFTKRGVAVPAAVLGPILAKGCGAGECPAYLLSAVSGIASAGSGGATALGLSKAGLAAKGAMKMMFWAKAKVIAAVVCVAAGLGAGTPAVYRALAAPGNDGAGKFGPPRVQDAAPVPAISGKGSILKTRSFWRVRAWNDSLAILLKNGKLEKEPAKIAAPRGWTATDFEDDAWVRAPGPFFASEYDAGFVGFGFPDNSPGTALILVRGRFYVSNPSAVKGLSLKLRYRGGAAVYVNGREVGRGHLPKGKLEPRTTAEPYPDEAFVIPGGKRLISRGFGDPDKYKDRLAKRFRSLSVSIEAKHLRKGVNVLALELHRAPWNEAATFLVTRGRQKGRRSLKPGRHNRNTDHWSTVGLISADLVARGGGIHPNTRRAPGFQVWNADPLLLIYDIDYGDAGADPLPVKFAAARGGRHSGVLVTGSDKPITGLKATVTDLVAKEGGAKIPASAVEIRYQLPGYRDVSARSRLPGGDRHTRINAMDALSPEAPRVVKVRRKKLKGKQDVVFGAVCPVWFTVHVPVDCKPGTYRGTCTIGATGAEEVKTPLEVEVCDWTLPPPHKFRAFAGFHQSPETVAMYYKVPFWSEEHFKLLGESYRWLGSIGCKDLYVHLIERTNQGNAQSIVRWKRRKSAGPAPETGGKKLPQITPETHEPDFTALDRYLDTALEHLVAPPVICLYAWDHYCGTWYFGGATSSRNKKVRAVRVTEVLPGGGTRSAQGPRYSDVEKAVEFWKPVAEHVRAYLKKKGLEQSLMIGLGHDWQPTKDAVDTWKKLLPKSPWCHQAHGSPGHFCGQPVAYSCTVWGPKWTPPKGMIGGWQQPRMICHFDRDNWRADAQSQLLAKGHLAPEKNICGSQRGFGRMSSDLWPVLKNDRRGGARIPGTLSGRYPETDWMVCNLRQIPFLQPGPKGALSTGRLEMIRDGLQECEARIVIEAALFDKSLRAKLGKGLESRCRRLLSIRRSFASGSTGTIGAVMFLPERQKRVRELYELAGEVAARVGK